MMYCRAHVFGTLWRVSLQTKVIVNDFRLGDLGCSKNIILSAIVSRSVLNLQRGVLHNQFLTLLAFFCFNLHIGNLLVGTTIL